MKLYKLILIKNMLHWSTFRAKNHEILLSVFAFKFLSVIQDITVCSTIRPMLNLVLYLIRFFIQSFPRAEISLSSLLLMRVRQLYPSKKQS